MKAAVIFDMDGVIIDSEPVYLENFRRFFENNNVEYNENDILRTAGASTADTWKILADLWKTSVTPAELRKYFFDTHKKFEFPINDLLFPDAAYVLNELKKRSFTLALASSSPMEAIQTVLTETGIQNYFAHIVSGEMFRQSKPDPEIYRYTLGLLGLEPHECVAVEDSTYGIQAAKSAGIDTVAILDTRFGYEQSSADYIITGIKELLSLDMLKINTAQSLLTLG